VNTPAGLNVTWRWLEPSAFILNRLRTPPRYEMKLICLPSGDHFGKRSLAGSLVRRRRGTAVCVDDEDVNRCRPGGCRKGNAAAARATRRVGIGAVAVSQAAGGLPPSASIR